MLCPASINLDYSGQYEAQREAELRLWGLAALSLVGVTVLLIKAVGSRRTALQVIANVPLAAFGAIIALLVANRPTWDQLAATSWYEWPPSGFKLRIFRWRTGSASSHHHRNRMRCAMES